VAEFELLEKLPVPRVLAAKNLPGGRTQILNVHRITQIECHHIESDDDSSPEHISDTKNWLNWKLDLDNRNEAEDDWEEDNESKMELANSSDDSKTTEWWNVGTAPKVPKFILPIWRTKQNDETASMMVNIMDTRRNLGIKNK
jgi:hypothetical protein